MEETQEAFDLMSAREKAEFLSRNLDWAAEIDLFNELKLRESYGE